MATSIPPFKHSLPARLMIAAAGIVTIGGGLASLVGVDTHVALPLFMVAGGLTALVGIVLGVYDYPVEVLMACVLGPIALWPITMMVVQIGGERGIGMLLLGLGVLPVGFAIASMRGEPAPRPSPSPSPKTSRS